VAAWKAAWLKGAHGGWHAEPSNANPYTTGQERSAWEAGWRWAQQNPDRRKNGAPRLAHRHRRALDSPAPLTRALQLSAMGVTVFWISRAIHRWARGPRRQA
jgi:ribosome modulation factor